MPLIDGDEFGTETETDDGDIDFLGGHGLGSKDGRRLGGGARHVSGRIRQCQRRIPRRCRAALDMRGGASATLRADVEILRLARLSADRALFGCFFVLPICQNGGLAALFSTPMDVSPSPSSPRSFAIRIYLEGLWNSFLLAVASTR